MCGGCGQPLRTTDPGATAFAGVAQTPSALLGAVPTDPPIVSHDAPTLAGRGSEIAAPPLPALGSASPLPPQKVAWPGIAAGRKSKRAAGMSSAGSAHWWRIPLIAGIVLVMLVAGSLGTWALFVGPSMHSTFDAQMQSVLDSGINGAFSGKAAAGQHTIPAKAFNDLVTRFVPNGSAVSNIKVSFANGQEIISYSFWGSSGTATTNLSVANGHAVARGTSVDCPLCYIESGDEMEATFNSALGYIPPSAKVTSVQATNNSLIVTVGS
jgi:hypothetical protein